MRTQLPYSRKQKKWLLIWVGFFITCMAVLLQVRLPSFVNSIENRLFDNIISLRAATVPSDDIVIVDIDDISLKSVGQWPWPRYRLAFLLEQLLKEKPNVIGIDVLFSEADRTSLSQIQSGFKNEFGLDIDFKGVPDGMADNDGYFAQVVSSGPVVLSNYFLFDTVTPEVECRLDTVTIQERPVDVSRATGVLCNIPVLSNAALGTGYMNNYIDEDGLLRRLSLLIDYQNDVFANFSLVALMKAFGIESIRYSEDSWGGYLDVGHYQIPVDEKGHAMLNYRGRGKSYAYISAVDVLSGRFDPALVRNKIVLVGTTAAGLNDLFHTATDSYYPGVEVHATFIDNVLSNDFFQKPKWQKSHQVVVIIISGLLMSMAAGMLGARKSAGVLMALIVFQISLFNIYTHLNLYVPLLIPFAMLLIIFAVLSFLNYRFQELQALNWVQAISDAQSTTIVSMAAMAESRDPETGEHLLRTQLYIRSITDKLVEKGLLLEVLSAEYRDILWQSAPLHDIGKVGVPDEILLKEGPLTTEEQVEMKKHVNYGVDIMNSTMIRSNNCGYLEIAQEIIAGHHEKWDGSGYPKGLKGEEIPLSARLMALADVYDALISRRVYKPPFSFEFSEEFIESQKGLHFDPLLVDVFIELKPEFRDIALKYKEDE